MPRLRTEGPSLKPRALELTVCAAAGAALSALAGLLGRWSANPALGWALALGAAGAGRAAACAFAAPSSEESSDGGPAWAAAGALAVLAVPALLLAHGYSNLDPALLRAPLQGGALALTVTAVLAALASAAWSRAARDAGAPDAAAALAAGAAVWAGLRFADPGLFLAVPGLAVLAAAELRVRPWRTRESAPLRARVFGAAAVAGLGLAALAPNLLPSVWLARLQAAYPGGAYLRLADDGTRLWAAYRFSNGSAVMLRDGVLQAPDAASARIALLTVLGQHDGISRLLLSRPPEALLALAAQKDGALVTIADGSPAEKSVLDALGGSGDWRSGLIVPRDSAAPNAALIFVPAPPPTRGLTDRKALAALRARLQPDAAVGVLFPPGAPAAAIAEAERDAAAAIGNAGVADLPKGVLVLASRAPLRTDPAALAAATTPNLSEPFPGMAEVLAKQLRWRSAPTAK